MTWVLTFELVDENLRVTIQTEAFHCYLRVMLYFSSGNYSLFYDNHKRNLEVGERDKNSAINYQGSWFFFVALHKFALY